MSFVYSVSSLNSNSSSINKKEELSEATKKKLKALNIDISSVTSETEAKRIIAEEEAKKSEKTDTKQAEAGSQEEKLYNRIKNLARKIGIDVSKNENIETIFTKIDEKLKALEENNNNSNINVLRSELEILENEFKNITTGESSLLSAMDLLSKTNFTHKNTSKVEVSKKTDKPVVYLHSNQNATSKHHCKSRNSRKWYCVNNLLLSTYIRFAPNCTVFAIAKVNFFLV